LGVERNWVGQLLDLEVQRAFNVFGDFDSAHFEESLAVLIEFAVCTRCRMVDVFAEVVDREGKQPVRIANSFKQPRL
jgi:hypothetical protein